MHKNLKMLWNNDKKKRKMHSGKICYQDARMPAHKHMICFICATWLRPACKHLYFCSRCESKFGPCPSCLNTDGNASHANLDMLDSSAMLPSLPDMLATDCLSFILSQQKSIIDKYALDKHNLKMKMEKDLESLWNNYITNERQINLKFSKECGQGAAKKNVLSSCFNCGTSLRLVCEHMCLCSPCGNKPQTCPYCISYDG